MELTELLITICVLIFGLSFTIGWIMMLIYAHRSKDWAMFLIMTLIPLAAIPYYFFEYRKRDKTQKSW